VTHKATLRRHLKAHLPVVLSVIAIAGGRRWRWSHSALYFSNPFLSSPLLEDAAPFPTLAALQIKASSRRRAASPCPANLHKQQGCLLVVLTSGAHTTRSSQICVASSCSSVFVQCGSMLVFYLLFILTMCEKVGHGDVGGRPHTNSSSSFGDGQGESMWISER
jgi:hypothetical protein